MVIGAEMHSLAQHIIGSYEARIEGVAQIRQGTRVQVSQFRKAHQAMARQQRLDLAKGTADLERGETARRRDEAQTARDRAQEVAQRKSDMSAQLRDLDAAHQAMARQQRADLTKGRADLERAETARQRDEAQTARDRAQVVAQRKSDMSAQLRDLDGAHQAMARQQRAELAKGRADLAGSVAAQMTEVSTVHAQARDEWQSLVAGMRARSAGAAAVVEAPPRAPVEAVAPAREAPEEAAEEEAVARAQVGEVTPDLASLRDRVFEHLADHPDGTRLAELEEDFQVVRISMARVVKNLMDEGKVEKRGLLYFAI